MSGAGAGSGGFTVDTGALRAHGEHVAAVESAIGSALPGAGAFSTDAYGLIGRAFAADATAAAATGLRGIEDLRRALSDAAQGLRTVAAEYENADLRVALMFGGDGG